MSRASEGRARWWLAALVLLGTAAGPTLATHDPAAQHKGFEFAPPMPPRVVDEQGTWHSPFVYPLRLENQLERRYAEDRSTRLPLRWFTAEGLVTIDESRGPWLPLGADAVGRDVLARVLGGARFSLGLALVAATLTLALGTLIGAVAGFAGGRLDDLLMRSADFVLVLPAIYVVLALRAVMPLVLGTPEVFWGMALVLALATWPYPARGVRAIVAAERGREYAEAAHAIGAGSLRILLRHLLPAARGFLAVQATLLLPAFILAEATLSFVGLGFPEPTPSWGVMLNDAAQSGALADSPWLLVPAVAIVVSVLALHLAASGRSELETLQPAPRR